MNHQHFLPDAISAKPLVIDIKRDSLNFQVFLKNFQVFLENFQVFLENFRDVSQKFREKKRLYVILPERQNSTSKKDLANFPSQSFFGKYFKRLVGMSPSEYKRM
jgi:heme oxygenase